MEHLWLIIFLIIFFPSLFFFIYWLGNGNWRGKND